MALWWNLASLNFARISMVPAQQLNLNELRHLAMVQSQLYVLPRWQLAVCMVRKNAQFLPFCSEDGAHVGTTGSILSLQIGGII